MSGERNPDPFPRKPFHPSKQVLRGNIAGLGLSGVQASFLTAQTP